jgi:hypothetical protein
MEKHLVEVADEDPTVLKEMKSQIKVRRHEFDRKKNRKFMFAFVGVILGGALGYAVPWAYYKLGNALYERDNLEAIMSHFLGDTKFH